MREQEYSIRQDVDPEVSISTREKKDGTEKVGQHRFAEVSLFNRPNAVDSEASEVTCVGCYHNS
jgi:hypothetical protein